MRNLYFFPPYTQNLPPSLSHTHLYIFPHISCNSLGVCVCTCSIFLCKRYVISIICLMLPLSLLLSLFILISMNWRLPPSTHYNTCNNRQYVLHPFFWGGKGESKFPLFKATLLYCSFTFSSIFHLHSLLSFRLPSLLSLSLSIYILFSP